MTGSGRVPPSEDIRKLKLLLFAKPDRVGGGVCQVTSTLYNVVLQAGLGLLSGFLIPDRLAMFR